eukprot:TRINITY_DN185_c0_g1_i2.p1 TRINITY_DN185_c0_g1~~TRINITY_DN185_c0_g1_i2.p1  ORF type:complete len:520 (+),score=106.94 TRINITY_DN185_c0_g1_i2:2174-3733(+)
MSDAKAQENIQGQTARAFTESSTEATPIRSLTESGEVSNTAQPTRSLTESAEAEKVQQVRSVTEPGEGEKKEQVRFAESKVGQATLGGKANESALNATALIKQEKEAVEQQYRPNKPAHDEEEQARKLVKLLEHRIKLLEEDTEAWKTIAQERIQVAQQLEEQRRNNYELQEQMRKYQLQEERLQQERRHELQEQMQRNQLQEERQQQGRRQELQEQVRRDQLQEQVERQRQQLEEQRWRRQQQPEDPRVQDHLAQPWMADRERHVQQPRAPSANLKLLDVKMMIGELDPDGKGKSSEEILKLVEDMAEQYHYSPTVLMQVCLKGRAKDHHDVYLREYQGDWKAYKEQFLLKFPTVRDYGRFYELLSDSPSLAKLEAHLDALFTAALQTRVTWDHGLRTQLANLVYRVNSALGAQLLTKVHEQANEVSLKALAVVLIRQALVSQQQQHQQRHGRERAAAAAPTTLAKTTETGGAPTPKQSHTWTEKHCSNTRECPHRAEYDTAVKPATVATIEEPAAAE